jgi:hypothetical protein
MLKLKISLVKISHLLLEKLIKIVKLKIIIMEEIVSLILKNEK